MQSRRPRLLYLSLMRFPTEKAHGLQIAQNCEAFVEAGCEVTLWVAGRHNTPAMQAVTDPLAFYGVDNVFRVQRVPVLDALPYTRGRIEKIAFYLLQFSYLVCLTVMLAGRDEDYYYTRDEAIAYWLTWLKPRRRVVYEVHQFKANPRGAWLQRQVCRRVGSIIAITPPLADDLIAQGAPRESVLMAHDGIRAARFSHLPTRAAARQALGWPPDRFVVGFVGRLQMLNMDKGIGTLIQALYDVPDTVLAIVGGPDDIAAQYRQQWIALGLPESHFWYAGSVSGSDIPRYLCAFDVCAMPHPNTPQYARYTSPLKLFEYMASGTPVVASDLRGWSDVIQHDHNALLVPAGDASALAVAVARLRHDADLCRQIGQQAQQDVFAHYTWDRRARAILHHLGRGLA